MAARACRENLQSGKSGLALKPQMMLFCNAVRKAVDLDEIADLNP